MEPAPARGDLDGLDQEALLLLLLALELLRELMSLVLGPGAGPNHDERSQSRVLLTGRPPACGPSPLSGAFNSEPCFFAWLRVHARYGRSTSSHDLSCRTRGAGEG